MATCDALEYRIAEAQVDEFARDCGDEHEERAPSDGGEFDAERTACEAWIQRGINACNWLQRAEDALREAAYMELVDFTPEVKGAIAFLYRKWLTPCEKAEEWGASLADKGARPENLDRLLECKATILDQIQQQEWLVLSRQARARRFAEEPW